MPRFHIELPHEASTVPCARAVEVLLTTGSHFFNKADWGCRDGEHKAWLVVEVDSKEEARGIVPPRFRAQAKVVQLNTFSIEEIEEILRTHGQRTSR